MDENRGRSYIKVMGKKRKEREEGGRGGKKEKKKVRIIRKSWEHKMVMKREKVIRSEDKIGGG